MKKQTNIKINQKLKNTWETLEKIEQQFYDDLPTIDEKYEYMLEYIKRLTDFQQKIWWLYCEYNSVRKVSEETNVKHITIFNHIKQIKSELKTFF